MIFRSRMTRESRRQFRGGWEARPTWPMSSFNDAALTDSSLNSNLRDKDGRTRHAARGAMSCNGWKKPLNSQGWRDIAIEMRELTTIARFARHNKRD